MKSERGEERRWRPSDDEEKKEEFPESSTVCQPFYTTYILYC
jgi:hypothetical protein